MRMCPLVFSPIFKPKNWGGRRLEGVVDKHLDTAEPIGESWELADLENDQSVVRSGPAAGKELGQLVRDWGQDLLGRAELFEGRVQISCVCVGPQNGFARLSAQRVLHLAPISDHVLLIEAV